MGVVAICLAVLAASPAAAARPIQEFVPINDVGVVDEFLSELCGFEVLVDGSGHIIFRSFVDADGNTVREVNNFAIQVRFYSENGEVNVVDVGPDRVWVNADGSLDIFITGNPQSIQAKGEGRVYRNVGWVHFHVTFDGEGNPTGEFVGSAGQHDDVDTGLIICGLLD